MAVRSCEGKKRNVCSFKPHGSQGLENFSCIKHGRYHHFSQISLKIHFLHTHKKITISQCYMFRKLNENTPWLILTVLTWRKAKAPEQCTASAFVTRYRNQYTWPDFPVHHAYFANPSEVWLGAFPMSRRLADGRKLVSMVELPPLPAGLALRAGRGRAPKACRGYRWLEGCMGLHRPRSHPRLCCPT